MARLAAAVVLLSALLAFYALRQSPSPPESAEAGPAAGIQLEGWPRQLSWEDFRNLPFAPVGVPHHAAEIASDFLPAPGLSPTLREGRWHVLRGSVEVRMYSARSWVAEEYRTPDVLGHEQCHLDITGLAAREWVQRLQAIDGATRAEAVAEGERSYRETREKMRLVQRLYDHATRGQESALQEWQERIARLARRNENLPEPGELPGYSALGGSQDPY